MSETVLEPLLPDGFQDLDPYVGYWAAPTTQERWDRRSAASMDEIKRFYDAMLVHADAALAHLDRVPIDDLPAPSSRLMCLMLSLANCAIAVELHGQPRAPLSPFPHGVRVLKGAFPLG